MITQLRRSLVVAGTVAAFMLVAPLAALAAPGDLDSTFGGGDGMVTTDLSGAGEDVGTVITIAGGKIVLLGVDDVTDDAVIARFEPNGDPDAGFGGGDGLASMHFLDAVDVFNAVVALPGGKFQIAVDTFVSGGHDKLGLGRVTSAGLPDASFGGGDGKMIVDFGKGFAAYDMVVLPSGKLLVSGEFYATADNNDSKFMVVRLKPNGSLDTSFGGGDGFVQTQYANGNDGAWRMAMDSHGRIVAAGWAQLEEGGEYATAVARYAPDGAPDHTFSGDGKAMVNFVDGEDDYANGLALQGDRIVIGESAGIDGKPHVALVRLLPNGNLDQTFGGGDGQVVQPSGAATRSLYDVAVDGGNRILVSGTVDTATSQMFVARYLANGKLDTDFGTNGFAPTAYATDVFNLGMAVAGNGKIVICGGLSTDTAVARFLP